MSLAYETIATLRRRLLTKEIHPRDILKDLFTQIDAREKTLHAYTYLHRESALTASEKSDLSLPLGGIPIALKDNLNALGDPCTCASKILEGYKAPYDATAVPLLRQAGVPSSHTRGTRAHTRAHAHTRAPRAVHVAVLDVAALDGGQSHACA